MPRTFCTNQTWSGNPGHVAPQFGVSITVAPMRRAASRISLWLLSRLPYLTPIIPSRHSLYVNVYPPVPTNQPLSAAASTARTGHTLSGSCLETPPGRGATRATHGHRMR